LRAVAAHEFGHGFGINHSQYDLADISGKTFSGNWLNRPTMGTCTAGEEVGNMAVLSQDDVAAVMYTVDEEVLGSDEWRGVTANASLEQDLLYWIQSGGGSSTVGSGGAVGQKHLRWLGQNTSMLNTTRYAPLDQPIQGSEAAPRFRADSRVRQNLATDTGSIRLTLLVRGVKYEDGSGTSAPATTCGYPSNRDGTWEDLNNVTPTVFPWQTKQINCIPISTSWVRCETSELTPSPQFDSYDVQIQLRNSMRNAAGSNTWALADWARVTVVDDNDFTD
jgi:hypothetical protein